MPYDQRIHVHDAMASRARVCSSGGGIEPRCKSLPGELRSHEDPGSGVGDLHLVEEVGGAAVEGSEAFATRLFASAPGIVRFPRITVTVDTRRRARASGKLTVTLGVTEHDGLKFVVVQNPHASEMGPSGPREKEVELADFRKRFGFVIVSPIPDAIPEKKSWWKR